MYIPIKKDLQSGRYDRAAQQINKAEEEEVYSEKDRVLLFLDKGIVYHYQGEYEKSNAQLEKAERAIEDLFTKSVSKAATSMLLNDNALDYSGEVYEDIYINIFKALNYLQLNKFDEAYVEVKRVNNKLNALDDKYKEYTDGLNASKDSKIKINPAELEYYNNVFANYLSHIIFRAEGEEDNSRISLEKTKEAWDTYPDIYDHDLPSFITDSSQYDRSDAFLNVFAFAGIAPYKVPVGARITTFDGFVTVSDPTNFYVDAIPFPGIKYGWNFKFEFPRLFEEGTDIRGIQIFINGQNYGELELLENMANVAEKTFETQKSIIYFKTVTRAILKGVASSAIGRDIKKGVDNGFGDLLVALTNAAVDASEHADLRCWRTMPAYCFAGEIPLTKGIYDVEIRFIGGNGSIIQKKWFKNLKIHRGINIIEAFHLK